MLCFGCDQGTPALEDSVGPPLRLVASYPEAGEGVDCVSSADPACGVPTNGPLELRFDRQLLHSTAVRQSLAVYSGEPQSPVFLRPDYDAVERVLRYYPSEPLQPNTLYTVQLPQPTTGAPFGFRAFDGAPLGEGPVPLRFSFYTAAESVGPEPTCEPTCDDIVRRFQASGCARLGCHNSEPEPDACGAGAALDHNQECVGVPRMGLDLASVPGLRRSAISRVAHQAEVGAQGGVPLVNPARMGVQMPLVDPGRPGNSYLLFKTLLRTANFNLPPDEQLTPDERARRAACTPVYRSRLPEGETRAPSEEERTRLRNWFVRGEGMPLLPRDGDPERSPLTLDALHEIQRWIALGARCP
ncbi:MAG TPA: Ig-like domain-containing protein [Polyangiaceae bacterium]